MRAIRATPSPSTIPTSRATATTGGVGGQDRAVEDIQYVRFQATAPNRRGRFPGVFGLVNGLARDGRLTQAQKRFRRANND